MNKELFDISPKEMTREDAVANIFDLERAIKSLPEALDKNSPEFQYNHWFAPELYGREITMPDETCLTTEIHASENIAILSKGAITVYTEKGLEYHEAPFTMITKIGTKRAMICHGEVVFTTIHHNQTNETNIEKLVDLMTFKDEFEYQKYIEYQDKLLEVET